MIKSIQLLRTVAALGVVFKHYNFYGLDTGGFGVDIFFIISGFIIAYMVNKNTNNFMWKRIIRLSPLYYLATFLTLSLALIKPLWFKHVVVNGEAIFKSVLYIPYRIDHSGPILSLGWTLNNEMFFYLVMFLCILFIENKKYLVLACGTFLTVFLVVLNCISADYYIFNFYKNGLLPEFILGLGLYYFWDLYRSEMKKSFFLNLIIVLVGLGALLFMIYNDLTQEFSYLGRNFTRGIPSLLFVYAFLFFENKINGNNLFVKWGLKLGDASYAMYLFHPFIVFFILRIIFPMTIGTSSSFLIELAKLLVTLIVVCIGSILIYEMIDKPLMEKIRKLIK
jgi:exopolysaccharide production protein ExoZ